MNRLFLQIRVLISMDLLLLFLVGGDSIRNPVSLEGRSLGQRVGLALSFEADDMVSLLHLIQPTISP